MDNFFSFLSDLIKSGSVSEFQTIFIVFIVLFMFRKNILKQVFETDEPQKPDDSKKIILEKLDSIQNKIEVIKEKLDADDTRINRLETTLNNVTLQIKSELLDFKKDLTKWDF